MTSSASVHSTVGARETTYHNRAVVGMRTRPAGGLSWSMPQDRHAEPSAPLPEPVPATFDPTNDAEWTAIRTLGHRMLDDALDAQQALRASPVWRPMPPDTRAMLEAAGPDAGRGAAAAYELFRRHVLPYGIKNSHPRFFGWVQGNGTPLAMLADMLASAMNPHLGGLEQSPTMVERQVVRWFAEWFGIPEAGGLFVTGGTMANVHALACARVTVLRRLGRDVRRDGVQAWGDQPPPSPLVFYGSVETHSWAIKAAEWLGLGQRAFRSVPVDENYRVRIDRLTEQLAEDRAAGLTPFCVIGTAGTVNTGATDDLAAIADLCAREDLWFHVDGAFGALAALSPLVREQVKGMERADSLAFDLHKWGSMPFECACVLVRDAQAHHEAFRLTASYLTAGTRGPTAGGMYFNDRGLDLTRGFKALKVWMQLQADGVSHFGRVITRNVEQVRRLVGLIEAHPELECLAPAPLNIVCFRYRPTADVLSAGIGVDLDALNEELLARLQESGEAMPSSTRIGGRFALRVAHVNHRTTDDDLDHLLAAVIRHGRQLLDESRA